MGEYDALVEYNECAVRQFIKKWEAYKENNPDYSSFLKEQSSEVDIHLGFIDIEKYRQDIYRWYLIHPYGCIDSFIKDFKEDLKVFGFDINLDRDKENGLERLKSGMKDSGIDVTIEQYKLELDKYYHRCRNLLAHKLGESEEQKIGKQFYKIDKEKVSKFYPSLTNALSSPCVFSFDDYTLCTVNLKNITDTLTTDVYSAIKWEKFKLAEEFTKRLKKWGHNQERISNAIKNYLSSAYGIIVKEEVIEIIQHNMIH